jgi:hypothetical protein
MTLLLVMTVLGFMGTICAIMLGLLVYGIRSQQRGVSRVVADTRPRHRGRGACEGRLDA